MKDAARFFKALADEARLQILWLLSNRRELCVCDVMAVLEITQSKASRHLLTLKHAGLVSDRKDGLWSHYSLRRDADAMARAHLALLTRNLAKRADAGALLAALRRWMERKLPAGAVGGACRPRSGTSRARVGRPRAGAAR